MVAGTARRTLERSGTTQVGTLGNGNHFLELQADEDGCLWLMVHSGSRGFGPAVRAHHTKTAVPLGGGLRGLDASSAQGQAYLRDHEIALRFADKNRRAILFEAVECLEREIGATAVDIARYLHTQLPPQGASRRGGVLGTPKGRDLGA